jgi:hypothetical protein
MPAGTGNAEKRIAARPSPEACRASLNDLLAKVELAQCTTNTGYLNALGLNAHKRR